MKTKGNFSEPVIKKYDKENVKTGRGSVVKKIKTKTETGREVWTFYRIFKARGTHLQLEVNIGHVLLDHYCENTFSSRANALLILFPNKIIFKEEKYNIIVIKGNVQNIS